MTMWISADAIDAEVAYRRERVRLTSRAVRTRRAERKQRRGAAPRGRALPTGQPAGRRTAPDSTGRAGAPTAGRPEPRGGEVTVPAPRTSDANQATKQPT